MLVTKLVCSGRGISRLLEIEYEIGIRYKNSHLLFAVLSGSGSQSLAHLQSPCHIATTCCWHDPSLVSATPAAPRATPAVEHVNMTPPLPVQHQLLHFWRPRARRDRESYNNAHPPRGITVAMSPRLTSIYTERGNHIISL